MFPSALTSCFFSSFRLVFRDFHRSSFVLPRTSARRTSRLLRNFRREKILAFVWRFDNISTSDRDWSLNVVDRCLHKLRLQREECPIRQNKIYEKNFFSQDGSIENDGILPRGFAEILQIVNEIVWQRFGVHFQRGAPEIMLQPERPIGRTLKTQRERVRLSFLGQTKCFSHAETSNKHRTAMVLPFPSVFLLPRRTLVSSLESNGEIRRPNLFVSRQSLSLTSESDRMAKIFAIIVEKPGLKQLSAIKPNFNSWRTKAKFIQNLFGRKVELTGNAHGFIGAVVPRRNIHQMHLKTNEFWFRSWNDWSLTLLWYWSSWTIIFASEW